jgi:hypothetical protein
MEQEQVPEAACFAAPLSRICNSARNIRQFAIGFSGIASPSCHLNKENKQKST